MQRNLFCAYIFPYVCQLLGVQKLSDDFFTLSYITVFLHQLNLNRLGDHVIHIVCVITFKNKVRDHPNVAGE